MTNQIWGRELYTSGYTVKKNKRLISDNCCSWYRLRRVRTMPWICEALRRTTGKLVPLAQEQDAPTSELHEWFFHSFNIRNQLYSTMSNRPSPDALHTHRTLNYLRVQAERQCSALTHSSTLCFPLGINNEALHSRHTQCERADQRGKKGKWQH